MGCVYSNHASGNSKSRDEVNGDLTNDNGRHSTVHDPVRWNHNNGINMHPSHVDNDSNNNHSSARKIFDVEVYQADVKDDSLGIQGQIEITDNSLIYLQAGRSPIVWPLRFLRSYGSENDFFSIQCGRRCPTGQGVYVFKCSNAEQLFKALLEAINNASNVNSSNNGINQQQQQLLPVAFTHSSASNSDVHEYQNLSTFENDHGNFGTLPSRLPQIEPINRPHSSMGTEQTTHTYLNSASHNVIGIKSQPNYYISNPLSCPSSQFDGSKTSLNGSLLRKSLTLSSSYDSSTLPPMRGTKNNFQHEYVNSNLHIKSLDDSYMIRRKSSEQHLYENHELPAASSKSRQLEQFSTKMAASDDLSTFCYVDLDHESRKEKHSVLQGYKNKSARTTPEPSSYIQLDLKNCDITKELKSQAKSTVTSTESSRRNDSTKNDIVNERFTNLRGEISKGQSKMESSSSDKDYAENTTKATGTPATTVPYAQIDFAKTLALSNSTANHRKP